MSKTEKQVGGCREEVRVILKQPLRGTSEVTHGESKPLLSQRNKMRATSTSHLCPLKRFSTLKKENKTGKINLI